MLLLLVLLNPASTFELLEDEENVPPEEEDRALNRKDDVSLLIEAILPLIGRVRSIERSKSLNSHERRSTPPTIVGTNSVSFEEEEEELKDEVKVEEGKKDDGIEEEEEEETWSLCQTSVTFEEETWTYALSMSTSSPFDTTRCCSLAPRGACEVDSSLP